MRMRKTIMFLVLGGVLAFSTGCGSNASQSATNAEVTSAAPVGETTKVEATAGKVKDGDDKILVGLSQCHFNTPYRVALIDEFKAEVERQGLNWEVIATDGQNNPLKQIADLEDLISKGCDIIICSPAQADPLTPIAKTIMDAGIPLILVDRTINSDDYTAFVGGDNVHAGEVVAQYILDHLGEEANVVEIQGTLGASATNDRHEGFRNALNGHDGIKIIDDQTADYKRDMALTLMENLLQAHDEIDVVYSHNDNMAVGCINPIPSAGRTNDILLFGIDGQKEAFDAIKNGTMTGSVFYPTGAVEAVELAKKILDGETVEKVNMMETPLITIENVDEWYDKVF